MSGTHTLQRLLQASARRHQIWPCLVKAARLSYSCCCEGRRMHPPLPASFCLWAMFVWTGPPLPLALVSSEGAVMNLAAERWRVKCLPCSEQWPCLLALPMASGSGANPRELNLHRAPAEKGIPALYPFVVFLLIFWIDIFYRSAWNSLGLTTWRQNSKTRGGEIKRPDFKKKKENMQQEKQMYMQLASFQSHHEPTPNSNTNILNCTWALIMILQD